MKDKELQNKIAQTIHTKDPNAEAYLFDSRARGDHKTDSDWDILILVDAPEFSNELDNKFRRDIYKLSLEYGTLYSQLFDFRQKGDYGDMFDFTEDQVSPLIKKVPEFLSEIKKHIQI